MADGPNSWPRFWVGLSVGALLGATGFALVSELYKGGHGPPAEGGRPGAGVDASAAPAPAAGGGGESGEAGARGAYEEIAPESAYGLRLAHLKGFLLIAEKLRAAGALAEAGALVGQGKLEAFTPVATMFAAAGLGDLAAALEDTEAALFDGRPDAAGRLRALLARLDAAAVADRARPQDVAYGMTRIAEGLYAGVVTPEGVDPVEYQHAYGAALSAADAFAMAQGKLKRIDAARTARAHREIEAFLALFPAPVAPDAPVAASLVTAQASRVELALSGF
jgi:hypothetical protein